MLDIQATIKYASVPTKTKEKCSNIEGFVVGH